MTKKSIAEKHCFVVGPIGDDDSDDRVHADWLLEAIIEPVFAEHFPSFKVVRADRISEPGRIDAQVISALLDSELVIADLTTLNPNAFYEIGIRHMTEKPIIHMHLEGQRIPFDVGMFRSIKFSRRKPSDLSLAREQLLAAANAALADDHAVDNPVMVARGKQELRETASVPERIFLDELEQVKSRLREVEHRTRAPSGGVFDLTATKSSYADESPIRGLLDPLRLPVIVTVKVSSGSGVQDKLALQDFSDGAVRNIVGPYIPVSGDDTSVEFFLTGELANKATYKHLADEAASRGLKLKVMDSSGNVVWRSR